MKARILEGWERAKAAGVDILTEGIRLAQTVGEHVLQQIAERRIRMPPVVQDLVERVAGRDASSRPPDEVEFVCRPAGPDEFVCRPASEARAREEAEPDLGEAAVEAEARRVEEAAPPPAPRPKPSRRVVKRPAAPSPSQGIPSGSAGASPRARRTAKVAKTKPAAATRPARKKPAPSVPPAAAVPPVSPKPDPDPAT
ncbi:MAG: hypothetical protein HY907_04300 [Deltaproteobacteria bacterium]|nr:hypothetical protein [Deltaproteobacteria bacterium]